MNETTKTDAAKTVVMETFAQGLSVGLTRPECTDGGHDVGGGGGIGGGWSRGGVKPANA
ncbi:hypothetical protein [Ensifer aridi]|uniref:hypothetical protein n=1 Tax=Ensifer aridi TaxID=1708715 RepID=UPI001552147A|nr:hypothetical protein [Ensifer aridi]